MIGRKKYNRGVRDRQVHDHISEERMSTQAGGQAGRQAGGRTVFLPLVRLRRSMSSIGIGPSMRLTSFQGWGPLDSTRGENGRGKKGWLMSEGEGMEKRVRGIR
jgi:hypothetical protein